MIYRASFGTKLVHHAGLWMTIYPHQVTYSAVYGVALALVQPCDTVQKHVVEHSTSSRYHDLLPDPVATFFAVQLV